MSEANKAVVRRLYAEALNQGNLAVIDELYAPDVELHIPGVPEDPFGPGPIHQLVGMIRAAFPGLRVTVDDLIAAGDKVVARVTLSLPHDGRLLGVGPQSRLAGWTRIDVFRLFRGQIIEQWADRDDMGLLQQLGVPVPRRDPAGQVRAAGYA